MARQKTTTTQVKPDLIQVVLSQSQTIGATGTIVLLDSTAISSGTRLTRNANTVVIGAGVTKVRVSYTLMAESAGGAGYVYSRLRRNTTEVSQAIDNNSAGAFKCTSECKVITVTAGDTISLITDSGSGTFVLGVGRHSFMLVEVIE